MTSASYAEIPQDLAMVHKTIVGFDFQNKRILSLLGRKKNENKKVRMHPDEKGSHPHEGV